MSLYWRIFVLNAAVLVVATVTLLVGPVSVSTPVVLTEALVLGAGLVIMLVANALLLRVAIAPIRRLSRSMGTVDLLDPQPRDQSTARPGVLASELDELTSAFNAMLDRLEAERTASAARALSAQESERARVAQELHDEVGQTLTAVLLELKSAADQAGEPTRSRLRESQELTRSSLDEIRRIARRLRPGVLEQLGLPAALRSLADDIDTRANLTVRLDLDSDLQGLGTEAELVAYRVAQESLTNVVRHASARHVDIALRRSDDGVRLTVRDDGLGIAAIEEGAGIRGMRERALLIGARLTIGPAPAGGTVVRLDLLAADRSAAHA